MKAKYIIASLVAACVLAIGCTNDKLLTLDEIQLSSSYVAISPDGGEVKVTVNATTDWTLDYDVAVSKDSLSAEKGVVKYKEGQKQMSVEGNQWVTVTPLSGNAGTSTLTFKAEATESSREITLKIKAGDKYQNVIVAQTKDVKHDVTPIKDVMNFTAADNGKVLRLEGTCTAIANTSYGNFYMQDADGNEVYIYGTVDESGSYNWGKFNIEVSDKVVVEGPYSYYNGTHELVDAAFVSVEKSLLITKEATKTIEKTAEPFSITITQKGVGLTSESQTEWLTLGNGYDTDSKGNYIFTVTPTENTTGKTRTGTLKFVSTKIEKDKTLSSILVVTINQLATTVPTTESKLSDIAATVLPGSSKARIEFDVIVKDAVVTYVNGSNAIVEDATGGLLFYGCGLKAGQIINGRIFGEGYAYNNLPEVTKLGLDFAKVTDASKAPQPKEVTLSELANNFSKYVSTYVKVSGVKASEKIDVTYKAVNNKGGITDGTNTLPFNHQSTGKYNGSNIYYYVQVEANENLDVTCVPTVYKTNNQLNIFEQKWIVKK